MIWDKHLTDTEMIQLNNLINDYKAGIVNPRIFFPVFDYNYPILKNLDGTLINPLVWYKFDGNATQMLLDSSGNGYNLTNNNNSSFDSTNLVKGNGSVSLTAVNNQYLSMPTTIDLNQINSANGISFSIWFRITSTDNDGGIFSSGNTASSSGGISSRLINIQIATGNNLTFQFLNASGTYIPYSINVPIFQQMVNGIM